ncbi:MAG: hypothetical protein ACKER6_00160 [Candidatus Hodgkinia cicadicola]
MSISLTIRHTCNWPQVLWQIINIAIIEWELPIRRFFTLGRWRITRERT